MDELLKLLKRIENTLRESGNWSLFGERYLKKAHALLTRNDLEAGDVAIIFIEFLETRFLPIIDDYSTKKGSLEEKGKLYEKLSQQLESNLRQLEQRNNELQSQLQALEEKAKLDEKLSQQLKSNLRQLEQCNNELQSQLQAPEKKVPSLVKEGGNALSPDQPEIFSIPTIPGPTIGLRTRFSLALGFRAKPAALDIDRIDNPTCEKK